MRLSTRGFTDSCFLFFLVSTSVPFSGLMLSSSGGNFKKELKCGGQIHGTVDIKRVIASKHQIDGRTEGWDLVFDNLAVYVCSA